jgi:cytochrome P450
MTQIGVLSIWRRATFCVGEPFALLEGVLVLATIVQWWHLNLLTDQTIVPEPKMTLSPKNGVLMRVEER